MPHRDDVAMYCDAIEECYEFMLAYAAQGVADDHESRNGAQLRQLLARAVDAASGLPDACAAVAATMPPDVARPFEAYAGMLRADAEKALAALRLVLAQPRISSQLVDNLNASLHVRTLLTDVFLLDEVLAAGNTAAGNTEPGG
ncbi:MAG: hypothetical protein LBU75_08720 [Desulfovibrio sp.]|nr:hypothetical protein [Desulfovibrio sp.]